MWGLMHLCIMGNYTVLVRAFKGTVCIHVYIAVYGAESSYKGRHNAGL